MPHQSDQHASPEPPAAIASSNPGGNGAVAPSPAPVLTNPAAFPAPAVGEVTEPPVGDPATATFEDLILERLQLSASERAQLERTGVLVSDRLTFADFSTAYAYFYWQDLPICITTDSLLHAMHATYDDLLVQIETQILAPLLGQIVQAVGTECEAAARRRLDPVYPWVERMSRCPSTRCTISSRCPCWTNSVPRGWCNPVAASCRVPFFAADEAGSHHTCLGIP